MNVNISIGKHVRAEGVSIVARTLRAALIAGAILGFAGCGEEKKPPAPPAADAAKAAAEAEAKAKAAAEAAAKEKEALDLAVEAYVYGYPLVTMEMTRRVLTNVVKPEGTRAPMGHFVRLREYPTATFRDVTAPNADTLYTTAWLDVSKEPWIVSLPDMKGRYFLMPMLDGWTNGVRGARQADDRHRGAEVRDHRAGLDGDAAARA